MNTSKVYTVKGMVCKRCITTLQNELDQFDVIIDDLSLGKVGITFQVGNFDEDLFSSALNNLGFALSSNKSLRVVSEVKQIIVNYFRELDSLEAKIRFSELISGKLNMSYDNISSIFTSVEGITIENFVIKYRICLVKQLLRETNLTLTDIAYKMGFSSIQHLSKQFKDLTALSPSEYRAKNENNNYTINSGINVPGIMA